MAKEKKKPLPEQQAAIDATKNTVVAAGAGSGKTTVLAARFSNLVTKHHMNVEEILTLTFTKKATVEMSDRIYKVLKEEAPEQAANFYRANIKTLDSYCNSVAKLGCRFYGVSPDFAQDDEKIKALVKAKALPFILEHRDHEAIKHFVKIADYEDAAEKLFVKPILSKSTVAEPVDFWKDFEKQCNVVVDEWNKVAGQTAECFDAIIDAIENYEGNITSTMKKWQEFAANNTFPEIITIKASDLESKNPAEKLLSFFEAASGFIFNKKSISDQVKDPMKAYEKARDELVLLFNFIYGIPFVKNLIPLMEEFQQQVMDVKRSSNILTFKDISNMALCILRDYPEIRTLEKKKYKAIMIDEFQDNNSDQRDMLFLLAENPERMEKGVPSVDELLKEKLFFVGDEKQSIYRFRGADVGVFNNLANDFAEGNLPMYTNHRSVPALIGAFNTIFGGTRYISKSAQSVDFITTPPSVFYNEGHLKSGTEVPGYEAVYHDVLVPAYKENKNTDSVIHLAVFPKQEDESDNLTEESAEAEWVACKILEKHEEGVPWSEIAVLIKKYKFQNEFERAFLRHGIPYVMENVKGLFSDGPVADMTAFMKTCAYEKDTIAYSQLLRSPFVNLSLVETEAIISLKKEPFAREAKEVLEGDSLIRFEKAEKFFREVKEAFTKQTLAQTVSMLWYEGGYRFETMWNHTVEMYDKMYDILFELARQADDENQNLASFVDSLSEYEDENKSVEVDVPLEKTEGVHIMSIHKSKGLEFDVVFLSNTHAQDKNDNNSEPAYISSEFGFVFNAPVYQSTASTSNYFYEMAKKETNAMKSAEMRRIAYVALTRARNELFITNGKYSPPTVSKGVLSCDKYRPGGEGVIRCMWDALIPVIEFYERDENKSASPFTAMEIIPSYSRADVYFGTGRRNSAAAKISLVNELKESNPYDSAEIIKKEAVPVRYVKPSKLHADDEETGRTAEGGQIFASESESGGQNLYKEIEEVRRAHPAFGLNNFGTIAHAYMEAAINGQEDKIPYSNRDIVALDGKAEDVKKIEEVCSQMRETFKKSELGQAAMNSSWHKAEYTFRSRVAGKIISGSIDLVFENPDGSYTVVDYKTNQRVEPEIYYNQLACYRQAVSQMMNVPPEKVSCWLHYLRYDQSVDVTADCDKVNLEQAVLQIEM